MRLAGVPRRDAPWVEERCTLGTSERCSVGTKGEMLHGSWSSQALPDTLDDLEYGCKNNTMETSATTPILIYNNNESTNTMKTSATTHIWHQKVKSSICCHVVSLLGHQSHLLSCTHYR